MKPIKLSDTVNYIAVFLTLACNFRCSYCINRFGDFAPERGHLSGEEWIAALDRIDPRDDLPITLQGGEPTLHPDFNSIVMGVRNDLHIDLLTNLQFDTEKFMQEVGPERMKRDAPYASIRVSYHPEVTQLAPLIEKVLTLQNAGYSVGVWGVLHPDYERQMQWAAEYCKSRGIDFRTKEFLGGHKGRISGTFRYEEACASQGGREVLCRSSELLSGPNGGVYRCHSDLYCGRNPLGNILDPDFEFDIRFRPCTAYGYCNPCDVKVKTNRSQIFGHTAVEIRPPQ